MIRKASLADVDLFYALNCDMENECFDAAAFSTIYESLIQDQNHVFFVAVKDGVRAGGLHMRSERQLHHCAKVAEMLELTVLPEYRNQGIGKELVEYAVEYAKQNNCAVIEFRSNSKRLRAHRFYERLGFVKTHVSMMKNLEEN